MKSSRKIIVLIKISLSVVLIKNNFIDDIHQPHSMLAESLIVISDKKMRKMSEGKTYWNIK